MHKRFSNRFFVGALCVGMATSVFSTSVLANPYNNNEVTVAGVAALQQDNTKSQNVVAPLAAAAVLADAALGNNVVPVAAAATLDFAMMQPATSEHPAVLAAQNRMEEEANSPYKNIAISQVENYVNIRAEADAESEQLGKIYNNAAATILETVTTEDGDWYKIQSGSVEGYIKAEYFVTGEAAEQIAYEVGDVRATITTETLRLRESADTDSRTLSLLSKGEAFAVEEQGETFTKLSIDSDLVGYVHNDYIDVTVTFEEAISIEEEQRMLEEEAERQRAAEEAAERLREEREREEREREEREEREREEREEREREEREEREREEREEQEREEREEQEREEERETEKKEEETKAPSNNSSSATRDAIVSYAVSFVGKLEYVYGGTSLTNGADCSGFIQSIYKEFGISLPRTSGDQAYAGKKVSSEDMRPGDIIYYGGHVAIYIGDGKVVHASSAKDDVKISKWNYRTPKAIRNVIGD